MSQPIVATRCGRDALIADCPFCHTRHKFKLDGERGVMGWWYLWSQCDVPRAFRSRHRNQRKYVVLRVPDEEFPA